MDYKLGQPQGGYYYMITERVKLQDVIRVIIPYEVTENIGDNDRAMIGAFNLAYKITECLNGVKDADS